MTEIWVHWRQLPVSQLLLFGLFGDRAENNHNLRALHPLYSKNLKKSILMKHDNNPTNSDKFDAAVWNENSYCNASKSYDRKKLDDAL